MTLLTLALTCSLAAGVSLQTRPDLSGTWLFDQEKTMQPGPDGKIVLAAMLGDRVVVQQAATSITLRITFQGDVVVAVYDLTGAESTNVSPGDITVASRASWKDSRLVIDSTSESIDGGKLVTVKTTRTMWIDKAGDLIVERTGSPASVVTPSRSVYTRGRHPRPWLPGADGELPGQHGETDAPAPRHADGRAA